MHFQQKNNAILPYVNKSHLTKQSHLINCIKKSYGPHYKDPLPAVAGQAAASEIRGSVVNTPQSQKCVRPKFSSDVSSSSCKGSAPARSSLPSHRARPHILPLHLQAAHLHRPHQPPLLCPLAQEKHSRRLPPRLSRHGNKHVGIKQTNKILV